MTLKKKDIKRKKTAANSEILAGPLPMQSKIIRKKSGKLVKQYPAHIGFHGEGNDNELSPEE